MSAVFVVVGENHDGGLLVGAFATAEAADAAATAEVSAWLGRKPDDSVADVEEPTDDAAAFRAWSSDDGAWRVWRERTELA